MTSITKEMLLPPSKALKLGDAFPALKADEKSGMPSGKESAPSDPKPCRTQDEKVSPCKRVPPCCRGQRHPSADLTITQSSLLSVP